MKLIVDNMSCQHCVKAITKAINEVDITNSTISQAAIIEAINQAGYTVVEIVKR
ncbi:MULTISPECIES: heavy-metal-associated domain-containing protein [unclassified Gilliamella]|uniref:heavy-metal-associated domain-containing protein n=1 Tax=unclassified Gilliamella TaxID=2685620 RepID=UPI00132106A5|nr:MULTISPECIES: heavy-metal-associated domain-containing protein [unclassified Gilliamella]MWN31426.1 copper chaperone [Gilliamella sp. Pra-s60]MWP28966.1 copper chaperone [Gilliamella sp. Pra-s54]